MATNVGETGALGAGCIPNIGPLERRKRVRFGVAIFVMVAVVAAVMLAMGAPRPWRLVLFLPMFGAAVGLFQVREKTCVKLAARGQRDLDGGPEAITDAGELAQVKRQARRVYLEGFALAVALTVVLLSFPVR